MDDVKGDKKLKSIFILILFFLLTQIIYGTSYVQNLAISPASPAPGQVVTITFQVRGDNSGCGQAFGIALSDDTTPGCGDDWLFANAEYGGTSRLLKNTTWWYDNVTVTVTSTDHTDVSGLNWGYVIPYSNLWRNVTIITQIPKEMSGTKNLIVVVRDCSVYGSCSQGLQRDNQASISVNIVGTPEPYKLDLVVCNDGSNNVDTRIKFRIYNWSESGVPVRLLTWRYYVYDTDTSWWGQTNNHGVFFAGVMTKEKRITKKIAIIR